jgi:cytochrome c-type biogenesis protein CcmH
VRSALLLAPLLALALWTGALAAQPPSLPDIEDEVMCVECGTALNISNSAVADRERAFIRRRIAAGQSKEQIKDALVAEFGPGVLALPDDDGFNLAVYVVPPLLALLALAAIATTARRWRRAGGPSGAPDPGPELDPDDARRLDRDIAAYDL